MNKKVQSISMICLLLTITLYMIIHSQTVIESVGFSISIWKDNLFPTLFPFFIISNLLLTYGFVDIIGELLKNIMNKYFNLPGCCGFVLAASLFSGFPSGAKYTKDLVENGHINSEQGSKLLTFTHYSNPLFILGMIGNILLGDQRIALIILVAHVTSNLLVGIIMTGRKKSFQREKISIIQVFKNIKPSNSSFGSVFKNSIFDSLNTMVLLLGIITIFSIVTIGINDFISLTPLFQSLLSGILEMTQGVKSISLLQQPLLIRTVFITSIISFGGLSVHMQVLSIIADTKIKYKPFLLARIFHSILAGVFVCILYLVLF